MFTKLIYIRFISGTKWSEGGGGEEGAASLKNNNYRLEIEFLEENLSYSS